jgi:HK97 family phage prohead protease
MLPIQTRATAEGDTPDAGFTGHTSVFGNVDAYGTALKEGAFTKTLQERGTRIPVLWQHDADNPIGKPTELKEDNTGLYVDASIVEATHRGAEAMALLRAGVPLGLSIGFETIKSRRWEEADDEWLDWSDAPSWAKDPEMREWVRIIEEVRLWEFSVVTFPANEQVSFDDIRSAAHLNLITSLIDDLRAGRIAPDDARHSSLTLLVAAYQERAGAGPAGTTPLVNEPVRRRNRYAEASLLFGEMGLAL